MRFGTVCSGIEAPSVAWEPLGWEAQFFSEIEKFPSAVLAHHYPNVPNLGDMTNMEAFDGQSIDLLIGGTPCQSFSVAGLRKGMADPRGNLALVYLALADRLRPRWMAWENVPGILSSNKGRDFGAFLGGLGELGYGWAYRVLNAQFFGVPQRRRRVFVVGCLGGWQHSAAVLFERESLRRNPPPSREAGERVAALTACGAGTCGADDNQGQAGTLTARHDSSPCADLGQNVVAFDTTQVTSAANYSNPKPGGPCHPLAAGAHAPAVAYPLDLRNGGRDPEKRDHQNRQGVGVGDDGDPACTCTTACVHGVATTSAVRRLTPIECERLQGFPDNYTRIPWRGKSPEDCPDGPRYKALGNSMAVPVIRWIGERIEQVEAIFKED